MDFPGGSDGKESACNAGSLGSTPGLGRSPGGGHGNPLQYSGLENPMDRGAWQAIDHGVAELDTTARLKHEHTTGLLALIQNMFPNLNSKITHFFLPLITIEEYSFFAYFIMKLLQ